MCRCVSILQALLHNRVERQSRLHKATPICELVYLSVCVCVLECISKPQCVWWSTTEGTRGHTETAVGAFLSNYQNVRPRDARPVFVRLKSKERKESLSLCVSTSLSSSLVLTAVTSLSSTFSLIHLSSFLSLLPSIIPLCRSRLLSLSSLHLTPPPLFVWKKRGGVE